MNEIASFIVSLFQGLKLPFRWFAVVLSLSLLFGGIWGYERLTGHFYLSRLERKITLLEDLQSVANAAIENHPELQQIYTNTVEELDSFDVSQPFFPNLPSINLGDTTAIGKAISGAFFWIIVLVFGVLSETKKAGKLTGMVIFLGIVIGLIALLFAWIGTLIPTVLNPWVNYIGFPLIQFGILLLITRKKKVKPSN